MDEKNYPIREGEAPPGFGSFMASHGPLPNPIGHTFPLLSHDVNGKWRLIGTGFYVSSDGLFITAAHNIRDVLNGNSQIAPLVIVQLVSSNGLFGPSFHLMRPIRECWIGESADIVLGYAAQATNNETGETLKHWHWELSWAPPLVGQEIGTYAFPNSSLSDHKNGQTFHTKPAYYHGALIELDEFRDSLMIPYPYIAGDFRIHGAASGGPIIHNGCVVGVNTTYIEPHGPGYGAQIRNLQDACIHGILPGESEVRKASFSELVNAGVIAVRGFDAQSGSSQKGRLVRLDQIMPTAQNPDLEYIIFA